MYNSTLSCVQPLLLFACVPLTASCDVRLSSSFATQLELTTCQYFMYLQNGLASYKYDHVSPLTVQLLALLSFLSVWFKF